MEALTKPQLDARTVQRLEELAGEGLSCRMERHYLITLILSSEAQALVEVTHLSERDPCSIASLDDPAEVCLIPWTPRR